MLWLQCRGMLRQALSSNDGFVYVNVKKCKRGIFNLEVIFDFYFEDLFFIMFEKRLWAVECLEKGSSLLIFDGLELVKIEE